MGEPRQDKAQQHAPHQVKQLSSTTRMVGIAVGLFLALALLIFAGIQIYEMVTYEPFTDEVIPSTLSSSERASVASAQ